MQKENEFLNNIENRIGYSFRDKGVLLTALTHSSYVKGDSNKCEYNERLEFLGDAVLGLIIGEKIFRALSGMNEGNMTRLRASIVNANALYEVAINLKLGEAIRMGLGEIRSGGREKKSILADCVEAIIGAVYLDGGMSCAVDFIDIQYTDIIEKAMTRLSEKDPKTKLQEYVQSKHIGELKYEMVSESGLAHAKEYCIAAVLNGEVIGTGIGSSKQEASQQAADCALDKIKEKV